MTIALRDSSFEIDPFVDADLHYGWLYPVRAPVAAEDIVIVGGRRLLRETKPTRIPKRYRLEAEPGSYALELHDVVMSVARAPRRREDPVAMRLERLCRIRAQDEADLISGLFD